MKPNLVMTWIVCFVCVAPRTVHASVIVLDSIQVGGYYDGGASPDNLPSFQNYFVGYGSLAGGGRTPERRSFFYFELPPLDGPIVSATLTLKLPFGGLIYGKGPGDPAMGPIPSDPTETFLVGVTPFSPAFVTSTGLTAAEIDDVFESFNDTAVSVPLVFTMGGPPPPADELFPIPFAPPGIAALTAAAGGPIVLTGWMPSWSEDFRIGGMPPGLVEGSELIWGLTDVHKADFPEPTLTIITAAVDPAVVPEASSLAVWTLGAAAAVACIGLQRIGCARFVAGGSPRLALSPVRGAIATRE